MPESRLVVDFWDVGLGDGTIVRLSSNEIILIDGGGNGSPILDWLLTTSPIIRFAAITHNDTDHWKTFLTLMRLRPNLVRGYSYLQDRDARKLKGVSDTLLRGAQEWGWAEPTEISPGLREAQILFRGEVEGGADVRLEVLYPTVHERVGKQTLGSNAVSAVIVLWFCNVARVVWPGDLPLGTCVEVLKRHGVQPGFFVGPHHGGPQDIRRRNSITDEHLGGLLRSVGHANSWISVAWNRKYRLPLPRYLSASVASDVAVRCSQLTPHCDPRPERFGRAVFPGSDFLGLQAPRRGTACMGAKRVVFFENRYEIEYSEEHRAAIERVHNPLCVVRTTPMTDY